METRKENIGKRIKRWVKNHKVISCSVVAAVLVVAVGGTAFGIIQDKKMHNSQKALELASRDGGITEEELQALEDDGGFADFGTEIVDPATGETVVLTQDENGNIVRTVTKDSGGNSTGAVIPEDHSHEYHGGGSSTGGGNTSGGGGDNPSPTPTPAHSHSWIAHHATRQVQHTSYVHHDAVTQQVCIKQSGSYCNTCGVCLNGDYGEHAHTTGHGGSHHENAQYETRVVQPAYDEPVTTTSNEDYIDYYYCECGARQ